MSKALYFSLQASNYLNGIKKNSNSPTKSTPLEADIPKSFDLLPEISLAFTLSLNQDVQNSPVKTDRLRKLMGIVFNYLLRDDLMHQIIYKQLL